jgi:hypothetical protein
MPILAWLVQVEVLEALEVEVLAFLKAVEQALEVQVIHQQPRLKVAMVRHQLPAKETMVGHHHPVPLLAITLLEEAELLRLAATGEEVLPMVVMAQLHLSLVLLQGLCRWRRRRCISSNCGNRRDWWRRRRRFFYCCSYKRNYKYWWRWRWRRKVFNSSWRLRRLRYCYYLRTHNHLPTS